MGVGVTPSLPGGQDLGDSGSPETRREEQRELGRGGGVSPCYNLTVLQLRTAARSTQPPPPAASGNIHGSKRGRAGSPYTVP